MFWQLKVDSRTSEKVMLIIDAALGELEAATLSRASSNKPRSFTLELMDQITEFLAQALKRAEEKPLQVVAFLMLLALCVGLC